MYKKISLFAAVFSLLFSFTSCIDDSEGDINGNSRFFPGYFSIEGENPNYVLYPDGGGVINLDPVNVTESTEGKGLKGMKRALGTIYYNENNLTYTGTEPEKTAVVNNAKLYSMYEIVTSASIDSVAASEANINVPDSLFSVKTLKNAWIYRGWLTVYVEANCSGASTKAIVPTSNLVFNSESIADNYIEMTYCYNRHSAQNAEIFNTGESLNSFDVREALSKVPGNDTICIKLSFKGIEPTTIKCPRTKAYLNN